MTATVGDGPADWYTPDAHGQHYQQTVAHKTLGLVLRDVEKAARQPR